MSLATLGKFKMGKSLMVSACLALFAACNAHAEIKVATVDFNRLMAESIQAKAASQLLQDEFAPRQRELQQKQKDLQGKQDKLQRDGAVMAEKDRGTLEKDLTKGQRELQSEGEAFSEEVNTRRNEELNKLQGMLVTEIQTFAKSGGYDIVIPSSVAVYAKESMDVTQQVLSFLLTRPATAPASAAKPAAPSAKPGAPVAKPQPTK
jgi:outer membrane protein